MTPGNKDHTINGWSGLNNEGNWRQWAGSGEQGAGFVSRSLVVGLGQETRCEIGDLRCE